jgi:hypothetical protein
MLIHAKLFMKRDISTRAANRRTDRNHGDNMNSTAIAGRTAVVSCFLILAACGGGGGRRWKRRAAATSSCCRHHIASQDRPNQLL